jgi:hypothetical protein
MKQLKKIAEDYVSFEVAKLLKEKGFDVYGDGSFGSETEIHREYSPSGKIKALYNSKPHKDGYPAPTHQMALKWLREAHNLHINIFVTWKDKIPHYQWSIDNLITQDTTYDTPCLEKYEEACEAAIKYCLTNLI